MILWPEGSSFLKNKAAQAIFYFITQLTKEAWGKFEHVGRLKAVFIPGSEEPKTPLGVCRPLTPPCIQVQC